MSEQSERQVAGAAELVVLAVLAVMLTTCAAEVPITREAVSQRQQHQFDVAARQQALNEKARPTFYYKHIPAGEAPKTTASTHLFKMSEPLSWDSSPSSSEMPGLGGSSGFSPSPGPFEPFRSAFKDFGGAKDSLSHFQSESLFKPTRFKSSGMNFRDDSDSKFPPSFTNGFPDIAEKASEHQPDLERKVHMLPTRDFRKEATALWGRDMGRLRAGHHFRQKRKRLSGKGPEGKPHSYGEQQYRTPYSEDRRNKTDYKYYEDHGGNDTYREHHYHHVLEQHNYRNASDNSSSSTGRDEGGSYSPSTAYNVMRDAKRTSSSNYNVDHVYKDGRYIPIIHRVPETTTSSANLSEGNVPDGPHVKHHYYYNEYSHDHRNKSEGPVVRHHYHNKDYKVFYHDHRNKSSYSPSSQSSSYTSSPDETAPNGEGSDGKALPETRVNVKHHHHVREYHYDEQGRLIDPAKYNYTSTQHEYSGSSSTSGNSSEHGNYSSRDAEEERDGANSASGEDTSGESRESYSGGTDSDPTTTESEYAAYSRTPSTTAATRGGYDSDAGEYSTPRPTPPSFGGTRPSSSSSSSYRFYQGPPRQFLRTRPTYSDDGPYSSQRPVGYQVHYRDYGDQSILSKDVSFDDGFSFYKERRHSTPSSYLHQLETTGSPSVAYSTTSFGAGGPFRIAPFSNETLDEPVRYRSTGYRRDVDSVTALGGGKVPLGRGGSSSALGSLAYRAFPDHTRSLVSRGNIGYILVDPLGELPTIRIHASLVNSPHHAPSYPIARSLARGYYAPPAPEPYVPAPAGVLRRADGGEVVPVSSSPAPGTG